MFCNRCGSALPDGSSACPACGTVAIQSSALPAKDISVRSKFIIILVIAGVFGIVWDVLAAAVLFFHSYSFFEAVVVCLLVMILCVAAIVQTDVSVLVQDSEDAKRKKDDLLDRLHYAVRGIFYAIAFLMALVKLVMNLLG